MPTWLFQLLIIGFLALIVVALYGIRDAILELREESQREARERAAEQQWLHLESEIDWKSKMGGERSETQPGIPTERDPE